MLAIICYRGNDIVNINIGNHITCNIPEDILISSVNRRPLACWNSIDNEERYVFSSEKYQMLKTSLLLYINTLVE